MYTSIITKKDGTSECAQHLARWDAKSHAGSKINKDDVERVEVKDESGVIVFMIDKNLPKEQFIGIRPAKKAAE